MKGYTNAYTLKERGWEKLALNQYSTEQQNKLKWVFEHLEPTIKTARCGWESVTYVIMQHGRMIEEYIVLAGDAHLPYEGRYINVSASSLGAIFTSVAENLW